MRKRSGNASKTVSDDQFCVREKKAQHSKLVLQCCLVTLHLKLEQHPHCRMITDSDNGIVRQRSYRSVDETVRVLATLIAEKGITLFAVVDHSGEAERVGLTMPNTKLLIFGHPNGGTPIMLATPGAAIDLPLKILVPRDKAGDVWCRTILSITFRLGTSFRCWHLHRMRCEVESEYSCEVESAYADLVSSRT